jgi:hypothetical protein
MSNQASLTDKFLGRYRYDRGTLTVNYAASHTETFHDDEEATISERNWIDTAKADFDGWEIRAPNNEQVAVAWSETDAKKIVEALNKALSDD